MNEFAKPGLANDQFPPVSATDNGKVLTVADGKWAVGNASGGTEVVANPTLAGTEANLTGLQVGDTKYKVPEGGGGGGVLVVHSDENETLDKTWQEIANAIASTGAVLVFEENGEIVSAKCFTSFMAAIPPFSLSYEVSFLDPNEASPNIYRTSSADGYPVYVEPGSN